MRRQGTEQSLDLTRFPSWGPASPAPSPSHSASRNLSGSASGQLSITSRVDGVSIV